MKDITKEDFLKAEIKDISQVYTGERDCCRCGCGGEYVSTSFMNNARSEINDNVVKEKLQQAKKLVEEGADVDYNDTYVDVQTGKNRTLTFYFDELK